MNRLYVDVHVPAAVTAALRQRGVDIVTAQEDGRELAAEPAGRRHWGGSS